MTILLVSTGVFWGFSDPERPMDSLDGFFRLCMSTPFSSLFLDISYNHRNTTNMVTPVRCRFRREDA
jgi:hypothetical protein